MLLLWDSIVAKWNGWVGKYRICSPRQTKGPGRSTDLWRGPYWRLRRGQKRRLWPLAPRSLRLVELDYTRCEGSGGTRAMVREG